MPFMKRSDALKNSNLQLKAKHLSPTKKKLYFKTIPNKGKKQKHGKLNSSIKILNLFMLGGFKWFSEYP